MTVLNLIKSSTSEAFNTTLDGAITADATSMTLTSVTGLQYPCVLVIDRQDASGNDTPSKREYVYISAIATNTCTIERAKGGSTGQAHNDGALVEEVMTASLHWEGMRTCVAAALTDAGTSLHLTGTASIATMQAQKVYASTASIGTLTATTLNSTNAMVGIRGQFVWTSAGALVTSIATQATNDHLPTLRARKNLTINDCYVAVNSCPSLGTFSIDIDYRSAPTAAYTSIFTTKPTIDVGEYDTSTAATAAVINLTSLASGVLLTPSIITPRECGDLLTALNCTERA